MGIAAKLLTKSISQCKMKMLQGIFGDRCGRTAEICCRCLDARKIACGKAAQTLRIRGLRAEKVRLRVFGNSERWSVVVLQIVPSFERILEAIEMDVGGRGTGASVRATK